MSSKTGDTPASADTAIRPTKKQKELLSYIESFIHQHGYSPSYREIMKGAGYTSVATVSLHVNNLIKRGHLAKRDRSARSLEIIHTQPSQPEVVPRQLKAIEEKWLVNKVDFFFNSLEKTPAIEERELDKLYVLIGALKVLGLDGAAQSFLPRLAALKNRHKDNQFVA